MTIGAFTCPLRPTGMRHWPRHPPGQRHRATRDRHFGSRAEPARVDGNRRIARPVRLRRRPQAGSGRRRHAPSTHCDRHPGLRRPDAI